MHRITLHLLTLLLLALSAVKAAEVPLRIADNFDMNSEGETLTICPQRARGTPGAALCPTDCRSPSNPMNSRKPQNQNETQA